MKNAIILCPQNRAKSYSNDEISFLGEVTLNVQSENSDQFIEHTFMVVENRVSLMGRDLCKKINISMSVPNSFECHNIIHVPSNILKKHQHYLSNNFKSCVKQEVILDINPDKTPIFCKARAVPFRYRKLVQDELERLESTNIIKKVFKSEWACPSVNVLKSNGKIRICGDYSLTVNKSMNTVQYPFPTVESVLGRISDAKIFSKLDLAQAYLQLPLSEGSKKFTTINTTEGLYQFQFLPFGIASSSAIFQSFLCQVLSGIDNIIIYQDDILILRKNKADHDRTLDQVLQALKNAGLKINTEKCQFYTESVKYLGYIFDENGVHPCPEKIKAITEAPSPKNITQVQSFIGLGNFYNRYIPNFSDRFAPLYSLLKKNVKFQWNEKHENEFQIAELEILAGNQYEDDSEAGVAQLFGHISGKETLPLYDGNLQVQNGVITSPVAMVHSRSLAENVQVLSDDDAPFTGQVTVTNGKPDLSEVKFVGESLIHSAALTTVAFTRGFFGDFGQYIVSIRTEHYGICHPIFHKLQTH